MDERFQITAEDIIESRRINAEIKTDAIDALTMAVASARDYEPVTTNWTMSDDEIPTVDGETDDSISDFVRSIESDGEDMPGLAEGLDPKLSEDLKSITEDTGDAMTATIKARSGDFMGARTAMDESTATSKATDYDAFEVEIRHDQVDPLLKTIYQRLQQANNEYGHTERLVLGKPQYAILYPWARAEHNQDIEEVLPVSEVIVVDGPMIQPIVPNEVMLTEYLREQDE